MHQLMGRRRALALATSLIVLTYLGRRCAWAQSSVEEVAKLLLHDREAAGERVAMLRKAAYPLSEETARGLSDYDYRSRLREAQALASVVADEAAEKQLLVYDYIYLVDAMFEAKVSPLPDPAKISPLPYLPVPVLKPEVPKEDKLSVVLDIILDALGLLDFKELCKEAITQIPGFDGAVKDVGSAIQSRSADAIVNAIWGFAEWFLAKPQIEAFLVGLAKRKLANLFLRQCALRLVPYVGWVWMLISLGLAIHRNWDRLTA
jgi:hypothetical protein